MTGPEAPSGPDFDAPPAPNNFESLIINIDGFEGPLDLLLTLAQGQKVDLRKISILALVEQYLAFINEARKVRLELAADYLVMAAWLAYLKSRVLLPDPPEEDGPSAEDMAATLQFRLAQLDAMRDRGARLMGLPQRGRDLFPRGAPTGVPRLKHSVFDLSLFDLLDAYADFKARGQAVTEIRMVRPAVMALEEALERIGRLLGAAADWVLLDAFLPPELRDTPGMRSAMASTFVASLEMTRLGRAELRQDGAFTPLFVRKRRDEPGGGSNGDNGDAK